VKAFGERFQKRFKYKPDHNGLKGYTAVYAMKYVTEKKLGKLDRKALAKTLHGLTISPREEPGILMETSWNDVGEIDRISFLAEVVNGQQRIAKILPKLGK
jgi:branched-chain amino acid transport system substrate-binding protein